MESIQARAAAPEAVTSLVELLPPPQPDRNSVKDRIIARDEPIPAKCIVHRLNITNFPLGIRM